MGKLAANLFAEALDHKTFWGPVDPQVPASVLQFHPNVILICDEAAYPL